MPSEEAAKLARKRANLEAQLNRIFPKIVHPDYMVASEAVREINVLRAQLLAVYRAMLAERDEELKRLRKEVERHHRQRGNDKCWENDNDLYVAFGLEPHSIKDLPPIEEYKRNCEAYRCAMYQMLQPEKSNNETR